MTAKALVIRASRHIFRSAARSLSEVTLIVTVAAYLRESMLPDRREVATIDSVAVLAINSCRI
jgi:hypothetical protein